MKTSLLPSGGRLLAAILGCLIASGNPSAAQVAVPRGTLNVDRDLVRVGTRSQLDWRIEYPAPVTSVIDIQTPNIIRAKKELKMRVRVLGASFLSQGKSNNGHGNNADGVDSSNPGRGRGGPNGAIDPSGNIDDELKGATAAFLPVEVQWRLNSTSWSRIFYGYQSSALPNGKDDNGSGSQNVINPSKVVLSTTVKNGDTINFGARGWRDGAWLPLYNTAAPTQNLVMLKNGDRVPSTIPALNGSSIESYLKPYMDTTTKKVRIGDRDLILLMELGQTNTSNTGFDLQDLVVLVTFE